MISINLPMAPIKDPPSINIYLLQGEPLTLVDTGLRTECAWEELNQKLENNHLKVQDIEQVILTHAHGDHYGLASRIAESSGAAIFGHADAAARFRFDGPDWERGNDFLLRTLLRTGAPKTPLVKRLVLKDDDPLVAPVELTGIVGNGDRVTEGKEKWEILELPGHAPGIIGLYQPDTHELITSDTLLPETNSRPNLYMPLNEDESRYPYMVDYIATLKNLAELDLKRAWPAHGERIDQVSEKSLHWIHKHRQQLAMFAETLQEGEKTAYEVWKALFPRVLPFDPVKGLIEVISYLDLPVCEGQIIVIERDDMDYYQLVK
jgi:glyoxylase-like metal-dependent hydrolase (beta-lactamase superfamily II)